MIESFVTAFIIYFVVIYPIGNAPIFLAVTGYSALLAVMAATGIILCLAVVAEGWL